MATRREEAEFERRVREAEEAGVPDARETLTVASGRSQGCVESAPDVTLAEAVNAQPRKTLAERVRETNHPRFRLVEDSDEQAATAIFFGHAKDPT